MFYDLMSGYYHVGLFQAPRTYVGFKWGGKYYVYNCLIFGLSTASWVFLKVMRKTVMHWRRRSIRVLPYLDDFVFMEHGFWQCVRLARRLKNDLFLAALKINVPNCHVIPEAARV